MRMLLLGLLALGGAGLGMPPPAVAAEPPPFAFELHFADLAPGVPQTESAQFTLQRAGDLVALEWEQRSGVFTVLGLGTEVCDATGACTDPEGDAVPVPFPAGAVTVTVTATMSGAGGDTTGTAVGRLTFTGQDPASGPGSGALGGTGVEGWAAAAWAVALLAVGALALRSRRRGPSASRGAEPRDGSASRSVPRAADPRESG
ncbi:hypothetical protein ASE68_03765 [Agromyces sp. Leaf222]|nr:hypothetical protein ASE68_03765 [Agromyces sp. Leaf222]